MKKFFINSELLTKINIISFCLLILLPFEYFLIWILGFIICLLLFKKNKVQLNDSLSNSPDIVISPVTGKVIGIDEKDSMRIIKLKVSMFRNFGLYFPFSSVVEELKHIGKNKINLFFSDKTDDESSRYEIVFSNKLGNELKLNVFDSFFFPEAHIWPTIGDKGRVSANFGFVPFGGIIEVITTKDADQLVSTGDKVLAGGTPLLGFRLDQLEK